MALSLILLGYWTLGWFVTTPLVRWQDRWLGWDRTLLDQFRLRQIIEVGGAFLPSLLENVYLLLYAIPAASLGALYYFGKRPNVNRYLAVLFLGTFLAYAMLPLVPVTSPRVAFPGQDLPSYTGGARSINTWLLDHLDISTGVFPSGHCAVAFSSAFGLMAALRRRWITITAFLLALIVYAATIYGRYHYAADGLASIFISLAAWRFLEWSASHD
jgi:membrane-associated phospholipid phosphatase